MSCRPGAGQDQYASARRRAKWQTGPEPRWRDEPSARRCGSIVSGLEGDAQAGTAFVGVIGITKARTGARSAPGLGEARGLRSSYSSSHKEDA